VANPAAAKNASFASRLPTLTRIQLSNVTWLSCLRTSTPFAKKLLKESTASGVPTRRKFAFDGTTFQVGYSR